jgi:hypothetical protein
MLLILSGRTSSINGTSSNSISSRNGHTTTLIATNLKQRVDTQGPACTPGCSPQVLNCHLKLGVSRHFDFIAS